MKKNIAEILKNYPDGLPQWSPAYGNVELKKATDTGVIIRTKCGYPQLDVDGKIYAEGECMLFPSQEQRDWDKFWPYKDGDVLYIKTKRNEYVFIYREQEDENYIGCYANLGNWKYFTSNPGKYVCHKSNMVTIRYATEGEIDALHRAIEKEDKIWDPVKKIWKVLRVAAEEKAEKFDINTLKPFDKVLVRDDSSLKWTIEFWMAYAPNAEDFRYHCFRDLYGQCIPYEGNEHLLLTEDMPDEYYITWEE